MLGGDPLRQPPAHRVAPLSHTHYFTPPPEPATASLDQQHPTAASTNHAQATRPPPRLPRAPVRVHPHPRPPQQPALEREDGALHKPPTQDADAPGQAAGAPHLERPASSMSTERRVQQMQQMTRFLTSHGYSNAPGS